MGAKLIAIEAPEPYLAVTWQVNNYCNFKCSYCNPGNWGGTDLNNDNLDKYLENLSIIIGRYKAKGYKNFKFFFSGGEPTAWRNFIPICEWLSAELPRATIAVNTNLSNIFPTPAFIQSNYLNLTGGTIVGDIKALNISGATIYSGNTDLSIIINNNATFVTYFSFGHKVAKNRWDPKESMIITLK